MTLSEDLAKKIVKQREEIASFVGIYFAREMRWKLICFIFFIASLFDFRVGITGAFICSCFLWDKELSVYGKVFETNKETRNK